MANWWDKNLTDKQKFRLQEPKDPSLLDVVSAVPNPVGDVASGLLAAQDVSKGNYGTAALNSLGLLPFVPSMGGIIKTFNGKNLNKPLLDKFIKENKLSKDEYAIYEDNSRKMADEGLHNINQANAQANPYYDKYKSMFDADIFRGMRDDVSSMNPNVGTGARSNTGIWATNNPYNASTYAGYSDGGAVYPLKVITKDFAVVDVGNKNWNRIPISNNPVEDTLIRNADNTDDSLSSYVNAMDDDFTDTNTIAEIAKQNLKNKGIIFSGVRDIGGAPQGANLNKVEEFNDTYTIFDPSLVRSKFAAFDPLRYKSKDILAGVAPLSVGSLLGLNTYNNMQEKPNKEKKKTK